LNLDSRVENSFLQIFDKNQKNFSLRCIFCIYITEKPFEYHKYLEIHTVNIQLNLYKRYTEVHLLGHIFHVSPLILLTTVQFHFLFFIQNNTYGKHTVTKALDDRCKFFAMIEDNALIFFSSHLIRFRSGHERLYCAYLIRSSFLYNPIRISLR